MLTINKLQCHREERVVVDIASLSVREGEVVGILGANGAGKSTLLRTIALLEEFHSGELKICGEKAAAKAGEEATLNLRRQLALVMQKAHLLDRTVLANAASGLIFRGVKKKEAFLKAQKWLGVFGVEGLSARNGKELSGGEAQRVSLARALACDPKILLLDEPFSQLDEPSRKSLIAELGTILRERKQTTLFVTHSREEILQLATRVVILANGSILQDGEVSEVFSAPACPETAAFVGMDSFYTGVVTERDEELATVKAGSWTFVVVTKAPVNSRVHLCVHPGDVVLSKTNNQASSRNRLACTVQKLEPQDGITQVTLSPQDSDKSGPYLQAVITRHAERELELKEGVHVDALIKATALHVFEVSPGESKTSPDAETS